MKRSRFSEEQIAYALRLAESGTRVVDVYRQFGMADPLHPSPDDRVTDAKQFCDSGFHASLRANLCVRLEMRSFGVT